MSRLGRSIPSLGTLIAFEAAARLGGFTLAARELGVTQAAVSRQIRLLEEDLRTRLFVSAHRRVELTAAGNVLAMAVGQSFERIGDALDVIRQPGGPDVLTVSASLAFSHFWLLPRLPAFRTAQPKVRLRVLSQDTPDDLRGAIADVAIRYGRAPFRDGEVAASMCDAVFPVCSPAFFLAALATEGLDAALSSLPRIDSDGPDPSWLTWRQWFPLAGFRRIADSGMLRFNAEQLDTGPVLVMPMPRKTC